MSITKQEKHKLRCKNYYNTVTKVRNVSKRPVGRPRIYNNEQDAKASLLSKNRYIPPIIRQFPFYNIIGELDEIGKKSGFMPDETTRHKLIEYYKMLTGGDNNGAVMC